MSRDTSLELFVYNGCRPDAFVRKDGDFERFRVIIEVILRRICWERGIVKSGDIKLEKNRFQVFRHSRLICHLSPDQFCLLSLLICASPDFMSEDELLKYLFESGSREQKPEAVRGLIQRLRKKLGPQLALRVKNNYHQGWAYIQPQPRVKNKPCDFAKRPHTLSSIK